MQITVLTPDREVFIGAIDSVKVPGTAGQFMIKRNHAPLVSSLEAGRIELVTATGGYRMYDEATKVLKDESQTGRRISFTVSGGFVEVLNNEISLLVQGISPLR